MNEKELFVSHIKSLKAQLRVLKARLETPLELPVEPSHSFAELCNQQGGPVEGQREGIAADATQLPEDGIDHL